MSKKFAAISPEQYPTKFSSGYGTNCLAFALGITEPVRLHSSMYDLDSCSPIFAAFYKKFSELFGSSESLRQLNSIEEAKKNEYVFMVFDFTSYITKRYGMEITLYDFHVARRELDGRWVHKPGWSESPCYINQQDWTGIFREFGERYVLFALTEEKAE